MFRGDQAEFVVVIVENRVGFYFRVVRKLGKVEGVGNVVIVKSEFEKT